MEINHLNTGGLSNHLNTGCLSRRNTNYHHRAACGHTHRPLGAKTCSPPRNRQRNMTQTQKASFESKHWVMNIDRNMDGRWKSPDCYDGVPRRPARRTSIDGGRSVGRWRSDGDISALLPPIRPLPGSPQRGGRRLQGRNISRWVSEASLFRNDSLPYQPGRRDSYLSVESADSSLLGGGSSLASSALNSRCSNVSVSSIGAPSVVAFPIDRLPTARRPGVTNNTSSRSHQSTATPSSIADDCEPRKTTTTLFLKLGSEATRNRKLSRSRSNQSTLRKVASEARPTDPRDCVTLPDDRMYELTDTSSDHLSEDETRVSDLFSNMEAQAEEQLKQIIAGEQPDRSPPKNATAKVA